MDTHEYHMHTIAPPYRYDMHTMITCRLRCTYHVNIGEHLPLILDTQVQMLVAGSYRSTSLNRFAQPILPPTA